MRARSFRKPGVRNVEPARFGSSPLVMTGGRASRLRVIVAFLLLATVVGIAQGCSEEERDAVSQERLAQAALDLTNGESVAQVKDELGQPVTEFIDEDGNGVLNYPRWQIGFENWRSTHRIHELERRQVQRGDGQQLRRRVIALRRGVSIARVEALLGDPDVRELYYERSASSPEEVLRYGPWELRFRAGRLQMRTHW